jgi:pimeloyl-ACP methyl ester carboxylesterase
MVAQMGQQAYDEFSYFHENLSEFGLNLPIPPVRRFFVPVDGFRRISGLQWGEDAPEMVLIHGGGQNAHTYDTAALALQRPLIAFDLPFHGHSDPGLLGPTDYSGHADDVAKALEQMIDGPRPLIGMSLGGLTAIVVAHDRPDLVSRLVLIDVLPSISAEKGQKVIDFINGPASFIDFDSMLARTIEFSPSRSVPSLRRGILHNAVQQSDGTWVWRHQQHSRSAFIVPQFEELWTFVEALTMPMTLLRGMSAGSVVSDDDEREFVRRVPRANVVHVPEAGHSIQGDAPLQLAAFLSRL